MFAVLRACGLVADRHKKADPRRKKESMHLSHLIVVPLWISCRNPKPWSTSHLIPWRTEKWRNIDIRYVYFPQMFEICSLRLWGTSNGNSRRYQTVRPKVLMQTKAVFSSSTDASGNKITSGNVSKSLVGVVRVAAGVTGILQSHHDMPLLTSLLICVLHFITSYATVPFRFAYHGVIYRYPGTHSVSRQYYLFFFVPAETLRPTDSVVSMAGSPTSSVLFLVECARDFFFLR